MPSLFSRARTNSTPQKKGSSGADSSQYLDEFGRVSSPTANRSLLGTPSKKDKKKDSKRSKTLPSGREELEQSPDSPFPDGTFLPLSLERPRREATDYFKEHDYGYLSYERHVVLGLDQVERLVEVISDELETRGGVTTPFIFSTTALDISATSIKRIIGTFLETCQPYTNQRAQEAEVKWREEARFAGPHELAMCLRWGLARVIRSIGGQDVRGLVSWEHYMDFRESEAAMGYPPAHFATHFLPELEAPLQVIIVRLLSLLARLVANSTSSGHTPPTLSPLFGPLFFGLGPATLAFHHAYIHYLKATTAMEHIILAFVRWQDLPRLSSSSSGQQQSGSAASLGVPVRLKEWIKGYPAVIPPLEMRKPQPRRGARTVRVMSVRRNVRMYSPDLVKTASTWAHVPAGSTTHNGLARSKEWERIAPATLKLQARYSEGYKKRMDLPPSFHPDVAPGAPRDLRSTPSDSSYTSTTSTSTANTSTDYFGIGVREGEDRFRSLTDLKWGEFESMGFSGIGDEKKLQFDLTESARTERAAKRQTLSWNDFSSAGFTRMDAPLSATLQFSTPLTTTISSWPAHSADIHKKLKKTQKALPAFGWDTEPVVGNEEIIEEAFLDVFCDLIYGGGWMDLERGEMLDRDCNWALVEYKSFPASRSTAMGGSDPRTSSTLILFEEFVPLEYREQLAVKSSNRRRLPSLFTPSGKKQWKQAATLNGRPYVVGHVPRSPSMREVEFEGMLHSSSTTKLISLNPKNPSSRTAQPGPQHVPPVPIGLPATPKPKRVEPKKPQAPAVPMPPAPQVASQAAPPPAPKSDEMHSDSTTASHPHRKSIFRLPSTPGSMRRSMVPAEHTTLEFDTRMASYSDDDLDGSPEHVRQKRRESSTDAWVDILVGTQDRRLGGQDAEPSSSKKRAPTSEDPDKVGLEVAQVLAAVKDRSPSPESLMEPVDNAYSMDQIVRDDDSDIEEVDTVPRHRTTDTRSLSDDHAGLAYDQPEDEQTDEEEIEPSPALQKARELANQRRLNYFDLHPERRAANTQSVVVEDIRNRLAHDSDSETGHDEDDAHHGAQAEPMRPLPVPPAVPVTPPKTQIHEPKPMTPPRQQSTAAALSQSPEVRQGLTTIVIPPAPVPAAPLPATPSKTAALIEMYRERERGAAPSPKNVTPPANPAVPIPTSRLPVRVGSLPGAGSSPVLQPPAMPVLGASSSPRHSPKPVAAPLEPSVNDIPRINLEETGRASPGRYVHGAPLHNVMEEDEE